MNTPLAPRARQLLVDSLILTALAAIVIVLYWPLWTSRAGDQAALSPGDLTIYYYPSAVYAVERLQQLQLPLWNPSAIGGHPFLAQLQTQALYPPRWLAAALALGTAEFSYRAFAAETIAHLVIAAWGAFLFVRRATGSASAGAMAGAAWGLSGYLTGYPLQAPPIAAAAAWLPWLLWAIDHAAAPNARARWTILATIAWTQVFLAGFPQTALYVYLVALAYAALRLSQRAERGRATARVALIALVGSMLVAPQLLPTLEITPLSLRSAWGFEQKAGGFEAWEIAGMIVPGLTPWAPLFAGVAVAALAVHGIVAPARGDERERALWLGLLAFGLLLGLGGASALYALLYRTAPILDGFRNQERAALIATWSLIMLAALGWKTAPSGGFMRAFGVALGAAALLLLGLTLWSEVAGQADSARWHQVISTAAWSWLIAAAAWLLLRRWPRTAWLMVALVALDVGSVAWRTADDHHLVRRPPEQVAASPVTQAMLPESHRGARLDSRGYVTGNWTIPARAEDLHAHLSFELSTFARFMQEVPGDRRWALLGVGCYMNGLDEPPLPFDSFLVQELPWQDKRFGLFCLRQPNERYRVVREAVVMDDDAAIATLRAGDFDPLRTAIVDAPVALPAAGSDASAADRVELIDRAPERTRLRVTAAQPGLLVVGDPWAPGWTAAVDGQPAPLLRAYTALRAVPVPAGTHEVTLAYQPVSFGLGIAIAVLGIVALIAGLKFTHERSPKDQALQP